MEISFHRGDIYPVSFTIRDASKNPITFAPDEIYFTLKKNAAEKKMLLQKRLSTGSIIPGDSPGSYRFQFNPEDTDNLAFRQVYDFDIEVVAMGANIKQTFSGKLFLEEETTHACNEGDDN